MQSMWRPIITSNYEPFVLLHNAVLNSGYGNDGGQPQPIYYAHDQEHLIAGSPRLFEALWSDDSRVKRDGRRPMKRCEHYCFAAAELGDPVPPLRFRVHGGGGTYYWTYTNSIPGTWFRDIIGSQVGGPTSMARYGDYGTLRNAEMPVLYRNDLEINRVVDVPNLQGLMTVAYNACMPQIRSELSLVNSVYELKDFKSLPLQLKKAWQTFQKMKAKWANPRWKYAKKLQFTGQVADAYLQAEFNIKPLYKDILAVKRILSSSARSLKKLIARSRQRRTVHHRIPLQRSYKPVHRKDEWVHSSSVLLNDYYSCSLDCDYSADTAFTMTIDYSYEIQNLESCLLKVYALMDSLGLNFNPKIVWDAVPWSFLVDWFVGIGQLLATLKMTNVKTVVRVHSACYSTKVDRLTTLSGTYNGSGGPIRQVREIAYKRVPLKPDWMGTGLRVSDFSSKEISLAVALGVSRWRGLFM